MSSQQQRWLCQALEEAVMWMEAVPGTGKMEAGRRRDFMPHPPMASATSHIMDLFAIAFFFFFKGLETVN